MLAKRKGKKRKKDRLTVRRVVDVPLVEVSGICVGRGRGGRMSLLAIGDRVAVAAWVHLPRNDTGALDWHTTNIARLPGSRLPRKHPQVEAVCADGAGRVLLLQESPARAELVDVAASKVVASVDS